MMLKTLPQPDYELIDSGNGKKLERYGKFVLSRPDPQALWSPLKPLAQWSDADAIFVREGKSVQWKKSKDFPDSWNINFGGLVFDVRPSSFKHTGLFPEHLMNWEWMKEKIKKATHPLPPLKEGTATVRVLNLFGYTGGASLACAQAGAEVTHVDGSKMAITWARKNQELSGLNDAKIRWILDDAVLFLKREIKRGVRYDAIIMDPPAFGHGPKGEVWKIEEQFADLMDLCTKVLSDNPIFFVINGYASGYSALAYQNNLIPLQEAFGGIIESGELVIEESKTNRLLPCGIFGRWSN